MKISIVIFLMASFSWALGSLEKELPFQLGQINKMALSLLAYDLVKSPGPVTIIAAKGAQNSFRYVNSEFQNCSGILPSSKNAEHFLPAENRSYCAADSAHKYFQKQFEQMSGQIRNENVERFVDVSSDNIAKLIWLRIPALEKERAFLEDLRIELLGTPLENGEATFQLTMNIKQRREWSTTVDRRCLGLIRYRIISETLANTRPTTSLSIEINSILCSPR